MGGIKLQLLCGVRIELAVGALPYLARIPVQVPPRALWGYSKYLHVEEGVLQTRQPLGLEAEPRDRGLPITGSRIWGPIKQTNKQTKRWTLINSFWIFPKPLLWVDSCTQCILYE